MKRSDNLMMRNSIPCLKVPRENDCETGRRWVYPLNGEAPSITNCLDQKTCDPCRRTPHNRHIFTMALYTWNSLSRGTRDSGVWLAGGEYKACKEVCYDNGVAYFERNSYDWSGSLTQCRPRVQTFDFQQFS